MSRTVYPVLTPGRRIESTDQGYPTISPALPPILIVEDEPHHATILSRVLKRARIANPILVFGRADDALAYLRKDEPGAGPDADETPVLVLLDLGLPDVSGLEVLSMLRLVHDQAHLPVVILSGSGESADIDRAFEIGANAYLVKPVAFEALIDTLENLALTRALLPTSALESR